MNILCPSKVYTAVKEKIIVVTSGIYYCLASFHRKHHCKILKIHIPSTGENISIEFSMAFKQNLFIMSPLDIIDKNALISFFSQEDAAMIGLLSSTLLHDTINKRNEQITKIHTLFPKLKDRLSYEHL